MTPKQARDWSVRHADEMERQRNKIAIMRLAISTAIFDLLAANVPYKAFPKSVVKNVIRDLDRAWQ